MQIKVSNIRTYKTKVLYEGKIILIECEDGLIFKHKDKLTDYDNSRKFYILEWNASKTYKPIIISETEKIQPMDYVYNVVEKIIGRSSQDGDTYLSKDWVKILVLPEQFLSEHLQAIVDGKMKEGDKILVECDKLLNGDRFNNLHIWYQIKLNSQGYVIFHKNEEKLYSVEELTKLFKEYLEIRDNGEKIEHYETERDYADIEISAFIIWLMGKR